MGGRSSKPPKPVPLQSYGNGFILYEGCMALPAVDYDDDQMMKAPFLTVPIIGANINEVIQWSKRCIECLGANDMSSFFREFGVHVAGFGVNGVYTDTYSSTNVLSGATLASTQTTNSTKAEQLQQLERDIYDPNLDFRQRLTKLLEYLNLQNDASRYIDHYEEQTIANALKKDNDNDMSVFTLPKSLKSARYKQLTESANVTTPQLPSLSTPSLNQSSSSSETQRPPYKFLGPAYLFVANNVEGFPYMEAYLYFPSMTKDLLPSPNYDFLGKSHRWLFRFINDASFYATGARCERICYGTSTIQSKQRNVPNSFLACGCRTEENDELCGKLEQREIKNKDGKVVSKLPPFVVSYVVYRINPYHADVRNKFAPDSPLELVLNIMASGWEMYPGCKYSLISRNNRYFTRIESVEVPVPGSYQRGRKRFGRRRRPATQLVEPAGKFGVYRNVLNENLVDLCIEKKKPKFMVPIIDIQKKGYPQRMVLEDGVLTFYMSADIVDNDDEVAVWSIEVAEPGAAEPLAMVLLDNGRFDIFDRNGTSVMNAKFRQYQEEQWAAYETGNPSLVHNDDRTNQISVSVLENIQPSSEWDALLYMAQRIQHLKEWLRARNLLIERVLDYVDVSNTNVIQDIYTFANYDEREDYAMRFQQLTQLLRQMGYHIPTL